MSEPRPFLKSAGGKTKLLPELVKYVPEHVKRYYEPFVGGGALFWYLASARRIDWAHLSDSNEELVNAYLVVRDQPEAMMRRLERSKHDEATYYRVRAKKPKDDVERAARFVYLNKTCFNGLWRVNRKGEFNVPFGHYKNLSICDRPNITACCLLLNELKVKIHCRKFTEMNNACQGEGDLVYFDPPYLPLSKTSNFTAYTSEGFGLNDHIQLRDFALDLKRRGARVIVSNADTPAIRELYSPGFELHKVKAPRSINSRGDGRGKVSELIIT